MPRRYMWLALLVAALVLASIVYFNREYVVHAAIAYRVYHSHIFTPPAPGRDERFHRLRSNVQFYWDFAEIPLAREKRLRAVNPVLRPLVKQISRAQSSGENMQYSTHVYREVRWLLNFTQI